MPERLRVTAMAGAGKTPTCIQITQRLLKKVPAIRIAYIVFNNEARQEALAWFPEGVAVFTSHSLARRSVWPHPLPIGEPKLDDIVREADV